MKNLSHFQPASDFDSGEMDICVRVGRRIRYLRTRKGMKQVVLADRAELSREYLSRVENGKIEAGIRSLERIAKALDVRLAEMLGE